MSKKIEIYTVRGPEGAALVVNGTRVCGPKAWGGGRILDEFEVDKKELYEALRKPPTKTRLWRRVTRLAGELIVGSGLKTDYLLPEARMFNSDDPADNIRDLISRSRYLGDCARLTDKLEAALKAWEAAP